ncbi:MAG TPA: hypothetical protein VJ964_16525 [Balneolaceae bacterium]|nr:hypothetical protein [Balneolaceae bacterium]
MKKVIVLCSVLLLSISIACQAQKHSTQVVVRAIAKDAKFIGSSMDGALITIKEANTGRILAEGKTAGGTGDTDKLVRQPHARYGQLSSPGSAKFETTLQLSEPTFVTVSATAPMSQKQSQVTSSTQLWLIPGKDITGDGILLQIPGFAIDILQPQVHEFDKKEQITITANAVMMCGCPTSPGGLWDSSKMEFVAVVKKEGTEISRKSMAYAGKTSTYQTSFTPESSGTYQITVFGYDSRTGNTGLDRTTVVIQ